MAGKFKWLESSVFTVCVATLSMSFGGSWSCCFLKRDESWSNNFGGKIQKCDQITGGGDYVLYSDFDKASIFFTNKTSQKI